MPFSEKPTSDTPEISESDAQVFKLVALVWLVIGCIQLAMRSYMLALTWIALAVSFYCIGRSAEKKARAKGERRPD